MDAVSGKAFFLMWATVICGPPFAFAVFFSIRQWWPHAQLPATGAAILTLLFAFSVVTLRLSFTSALANFVCVAVVLLIYYFIVASCLQIPFRAVRYLTFIVTILPICFGYLLGTVGVLGLGWIVMDYTRPPEHTEQMGPDLKCQITGWGSVASASGYTVHLYKIWPEVPFVEREVASLSVIQAGYVGEPRADKTCSDAMHAYTR
jgi:hypothetical protein